MGIGPRFEQAVKFLLEYAPEEYATLRAQHAELPVDGDSPLGASDGLLLVKLKTVGMALRKLEKGRDAALLQVPKRIKRVRLLGLISSLLGVVSTGTLVTVLAKDYAKEAGYLAALLNLAALSVPVFAAYVESKDASKGRDLHTLHVDLWNLETEASQLLPQIDYCLENSCEADDAATLIGQANKLLSDTRQVLTELS